MARHGIQEQRARPGRLHPTDLRQDKNREVRRGRSVEERRQIRRFARGAITQNSLPIDTTPSKTATTRTSRAPAS